MGYYYFPYSGLFNAICSLSLGCFVLFNNTKSSTKRRFAFFSFSVSFWAFNYFMWLISKQESSALFFIRSAMVGAILIPAAYGYFITGLMGQKRKLMDVINFIAAIFFIACSFSPLYIQRVEPRLFFSYWPVPGYIFNFMLLYFVVHVVYIILTIWKEVRNSFGVRKLQMKYVLFGTIIGYLGGCTNYFLWYKVPIPPYLNILVSGFVICVAYAIARHQFMDIEVIIKKTLVFAGLFITSYAVFASFVYLGSLLFENVIQSRWIALIPSVFIIVLILRPLENYLRNATDKYLFQKKYDYRHLLRTFSDEVLTVLDLDMLVNLTVNKLVQIIKLENAGILIYDEDNERYKMVASTGMDVLGYSLREEDPIIKFLSRGNKYILMDNLSEHVDIYKDIKASAGMLNPALIVPLTHQDNTVGILTLGKKKSDEEFSQDDIDIILPLARTLSMAITNAQLFEELSESQAQAAQREKMAVIGTLSAGINHEICNPLGIARGQCEMFLLNMKEGIYKDKSQEELLEKAQEIMNKVINETDRATVITRKLSSFAKPAKGNTADNVDIKEEIDQVVSLVEHDLKMDNILIKKEIEDVLPLISADKKQVQEIFFNIIRNAAQSIKEGNGEIRVKAFNHDKFVHVDVEDTGEGISKTNLGKIFNPFFTTKDPGRGTGLGLFIVKQIVERNNGTISAKSTLGKGTTFSLTFTCAEVV